MVDNDLNAFVDLIRSQFNEKLWTSIDANTDIKLLNEWTSLQTMIIVNEIDKAYGVVMDSDDFKNSDSLATLFNMIINKKN